MSGGLRERLQRLRGSSAGSRPEEPLADEAAYGRDADEADGRADGESAAGGTQLGANAGAGADDLAAADDAPGGLHPAFAKLGIRQIDNEYGSFLLRRCEYPLEYRHGLYELGELLGCADRLKPVAARQNHRNGPEAKGRRSGSKETALGRGRGAAPDADAAPPIEAERLLFLDTETTGLGVGAGNVPFMIGIGYNEPADGRFVVEQTLIRHPGEEKAMLQYLLGQMNGKTHLVTYNGRSFDWPVLTGRFILNGWRPSGTEPGHLDFLHPSRALWRNTLESCRLSRIEEERLGVGRTDDVLGSLAPELYMRYLSDGDAAHLEGVYLHNERDILTLVTLATHFAGLLAGDVTGGTSPGRLPEGAEELYRTAAWLDAHGKPELAEPLFRALGERRETSAARWWLLAAARWKRLGRYEEAIALWERAAELAERSALPSCEAHVELAMHYEHRAKNIAAALRYAELALDLALRRPASPRQPARALAEREALRGRVERLRRKFGRLGSGLP